MSGNILYQLPPILLLPFLTHHLSQSDYGIVTLFVKMTAFALPIATLGIKIAAKKGFYKNNSGDFKALFATALLLPLLILPLWGILLYLFRPYIAQYLGFPRNWLWAVLLFVACRHLFVLGLDYVRSLKKPYWYVFFKNGSALAEVLITLVLISTFHLSYEGRIGGILAAKIIFTALLLLALWAKGYLTWTFNRSFAQKIWTESAALLPMVMLGIAFKSIDIFLAAYWLGADATGIYGVALRIAAAIALVQTGILMATQPLYLEKLAQTEPHPNTPLQIAQYLLLEWVVFILIAFILAIFVIPLVFPYLVGNRFADALSLVLPLSLSYVMLGIGQSLSVILAFLEQYRVSNTANIIGLLALLGISAVLAPLYGLQGMAWATCLAYSLTVVILLWHFSKAYPLPWKNACFSLANAAKIKLAKHLF